MMGPTVYLATPLTEKAKDWFKKHRMDETTWLGKALGVGHRFIEDFIWGMEDDGLVNGQDFAVSY